MWRTFGRDELIDMCIPVYQLHLKRRGYSILFYFPRSFLWQEALVAQWLRSLDLTTHTSLSPLRFTPGFVNSKKGTLDSQPHAIKFTSCLPMVGAWFSPGTPASSTTKTGRHDIGEILLKVALNTKNQIKSNPYSGEHECGFFSSFCVFEQV